MQSLIVVCALLFVAVTPFMARYEANDAAAWADDAPGADVVEAEVNDSEHV